MEKRKTSSRGKERNEHKHQAEGKEREKNRNMTKSDIGKPYSHMEDDRKISS